jgi:DNA polymerase-4
MEERLAKAGNHLIGDLAALPPDRLERRLGTHGHDLLSLARGEDERPVVGHGDAKSVGHEHTFGQDTRDLRRLRRTLLDLADAVARRLRGHGYRARTITLKYRDETFQTLTRAETIDDPTDSGEVIFRVAWGLFERAHGARKVRLLGVSTSGFGAAAQKGLFEAEPKPRPADRMLDAVADRFGEGALTRASRLRPARGEGEEPDPRDRKGSRRLLK